MRRLFLTLLLAATAFTDLPARTLPLTIKEVALMLRAGYSSDSVHRELSVRRFAGSYDSAAEKALQDAGAAPALIDAIKNGSFAISPAEAQAAQDELAAQAARRASEAEQSRKFNTLYQDQLARARAAAASTNGNAPNVLADQLKGDLVSLEKREHGPV